MNETVLSKTIQTKSRSYFFDLKKAASGNLYFTISESKKKKEGDGFERGSVMVFDDNSTEFFAALDEIRDRMKGEKE